MTKIQKIKAREILDSRGNPTVEVDLYLSDGIMGRASVPSGASTGVHEATELRDGDPKRYLGQGVTKAVANVNGPILKLLKGKSWTQLQLDMSLIALDNTPNKSNLGANAILGVSLAFAKAMANSQKKSLQGYFKTVSKSTTTVMPVPMMNILNGGKHAEDSSDIQEFMIVPVGAKSFSEALRYGSEIFHSLKKILHSKGLNTCVGDEGGFAVPVPDIELALPDAHTSISQNQFALDLIMDAIKSAGYEPGQDISLAIDVAASEFYKNGKYHLQRENKSLTSGQMIDLYESWVKKYPIISIEDGLSEDDWEGWKEMTSRLSDIQIVGDDLFATNVERLKKGIENKSANSILIKLNQIGTVSETIDAVTLAQKANMGTIISHRSGETEDFYIADFAVGLGAGQIKTGSLCRSERIAKYNQLLRIEEDLGPKAVFLGGRIYKKF